jgi:hypothetical protein
MSRVFASANDLVISAGGTPRRICIAAFDLLEICWCDREPFMSPSKMLTGLHRN